MSCADILKRIVIIYAMLKMCEPLRQPGGVVTTHFGQFPTPSAVSALKEKVGKGPSSSVSDPYSSNPDPDPAKNLNPDPERP